MKILKSTISLVLALIMVFSCCSTAFAVTDTYEELPQVIVKGLGVGSVKIYYEDDPEQKSLFYPFDTDRFIKNLGNIGKHIAKAIKDKNPNIAHAIVYNYAKDCFGMLAP